MVYELSYTPVPQPVNQSNLRKCNIHVLWLVFNCNQYSVYLILGFGFPSAAHFNVTLSPNSAVVLAGDTVITGGDHFDERVVGFSLPDTTCSTDTVTGTKNTKHVMIVIY